MHTCAGRECPLCVEYCGIACALCIDRLVWSVVAELPCFQGLSRPSHKLCVLQECVQTLDTCPRQTSKQYGSVVRG
jgi:hypothetical protein